MVDTLDLGSSAGNGVRVRISLGALNITTMEKIYCPKCKKKTRIDIVRAIDADGETFICECCKYPFRFVKK